MEQQEVTEERLQDVNGGGANLNVVAESSGEGVREIVKSMQRIASRRRATVATKRTQIVNDFKELPFHPQ